MNFKQGFHDKDMRWLFETYNIQIKDEILLFTIFLTAFSLSFTSDLNDLIIEITSGRNTLSNDEINEYVLKKVWT